MQQYGEFERQQMQMMQHLEKRDMESVHCPNCGSQWFVEVEAYKFQANHNVVLGQHVPTKPGAVPYYVLKCLFCKDLLEPHILFHTRDLGGNDYDDFLDTIEGKKDKREKKEEVDYLKEINGLKERLALLESKQAVKKGKK
jgi:hypothetical protein